jgi:hypothetical protein
VTGHGQLLEARLPESWIPPAHVVEMRTLGRLYCALMDERRAWQQRIHAQLFYQGWPPFGRRCRGQGATRSRVPSCRRWGFSMWIPRCGALVSSAPRSIAADTIGQFRQAPGGVSGAATRASGTRLDRRFRVDLAVAVDC